VSSVKIIFLDIDGVLNQKKSYADGKAYDIDRDKVGIIKGIADTTNAVIVLSSGWKFWFDDGLMPTEKHSLRLYHILCEFGLKLFGKTPDFSTEEIRLNKAFSRVKAQEIFAWLHEHKDVESYVVIDDHDLMDEAIQPHLIRTDANNGITEYDAQRAVEILKSSG
jgi:hypothetical protein